MSGTRTPSKSRQRGRGQLHSDEVFLLPISEDIHTLYPHWGMRSGSPYGARRTNSDVLDANSEEIVLLNKADFDHTAIRDSAWVSVENPTIGLRAQTTSLGNLPMGVSRYGHLNIQDAPSEAWSGLFRDHVRLAAELRQEISHNVILLKTQAKLGLRYGYIRPQIQFIDQRDTEKTTQPDSFQINWKRTLSDSGRAILTEADLTRTPESMDSAAGPSRTNDDSDIHVLSMEVEREYTQRIAELEVAAEEEGFFIHSASLEDFWTYVRAYPSWCQADLILTDEGCLCAIWYTDDEKRVEVEYLGDRQGRLFIFENRGSSVPVLPDIIAGNLDTIGEQISACTYVSIAG